VLEGSRGAYIYEQRDIRRRSKPQLIGGAEQSVKARWGEVSSLRGPGSHGSTRKGCRNQNERSSRVRGGLHALGDCSRLGVISHLFLKSI